MAEVAASAPHAPISREDRPLICGPDKPQPPYPIYLEGEVVKGFGRGGKELGCPTANLPEDTLSKASLDHGFDQTGIYYGYARVYPKPASQSGLDAEDSHTFPMVMSVGFNPFFGNEKKTAEVHVMHKFKADFYGLHIRSVVLGYIRPEFNYTSKEALIEDIETDKRAAKASLERTEYAKFAGDSYFMKPTGTAHA